MDEFTHGHITFLAQANGSELAVLSECYDYAFFDMGCDMALADNYFLRCDRCFLIGDLSLWHCAQTAESALYMREQWGERPEVLAAFHTKKGMDYYKAVIGERAGVIPFEPDPFCLHHEMLVFMEEIWKRQ